MTKIVLYFGMRHSVSETETILFDRTKFESKGKTTEKQFFSGAKITILKNKRIFSMVEELQLTQINGIVQKRSD